MHTFIIPYITIKYIIGSMDIILINAFDHFLHYHYGINNFRRIRDMLRTKERTSDIHAITLLVFSLTFSVWVMAGNISN